MSLAGLPVHYLYWHYFLAWRDGWQIYRDLLWFVNHFFSINLLVKTWFSPWRRLGETYRGGFNLSAWLAALVINLTMRLVGIIARTALITVGVLSWLLVFLSGLVSVFIWLLLPLVLLGLLATAIYLLI